MKDKNNFFLISFIFIFITLLILIMPDVKARLVSPIPKDYSTLSINENSTWRYIQMSDTYDTEYVGFQKSGALINSIGFTYQGKWIGKIIPFAVKNESGSRWLCPIINPTISNYQNFSSSEYATLEYSGTKTNGACLRYNDWVVTLDDFTINKIQINTSKEDKSKFFANISYSQTYADTGFGFLTITQNATTFKYAKIQYTNSTIVFIALDVPQIISEVESVIGYYDNYYNDLGVSWNWSDMLSQYPTASAHFEVLNIGGSYLGLLTGIYGVGSGNNIVIDPILVSEAEVGDGTAFSNQRKVVRNSTQAIQVIYEGTNKKAFHRFSLNNGTTWSAEHNISIGTCEYPTLAVNSTDDLYVSCGGGGTDDGMYVSLDGGVIWSQINTETTGLRPSLLIDQLNNSKVHIVYHEGLGIDNIYYRRSTNQGANWEVSVTLTGSDSAFQDYYPIILENSTGTIFAFWLGSESLLGDDDIYYRSCNNNALNCSNLVNWGTETTVINSTTFLGTQQGDYSIVLGNNDIFYIVYGDGTSGVGGDAELYFNSFNSTSGILGGQVLISNNPNTGDINPTLTTNGSWLWVEWVNQSVREQILYSNSTDGGIIWSSPTAYTNTTFGDTWVSAIYNSSGSGVATDFIWIQNDGALGIDVYYGNLSLPIVVPPQPPPPTQCNETITILPSIVSTNRPYGRLCYKLEFR